MENLKTEKKYRIFTDEVSLIVLIDKWLLVNYNDNWVWKTLILNPQTMKILEGKKEKLDAFLNGFMMRKNIDGMYWILYLKIKKKVILMMKNLNIFVFKEKFIKWEPEKFDRKNWRVVLKNWKKVDVWEESL